MSQWVSDIEDMHEKFGVHEVVDAFDAETLLKFIEFRLDFLQEELDEARAALKARDADGIVDALIDLNVVSTGSLDLLQVNAELAWKRVHEKNMQKKVGIKASRKNPLGLPDLVKPEGWEPPEHTDNIGLLWKIVDKQ